jgi:hypothetical protein
MGLTYHLSTGAGFRNHPQKKHGIKFGLDQQNGVVLTSPRRGFDEEQKDEPLVPEWGSLAT